MINIPQFAFRIVGLMLILTADAICLIGMRESYVIAVELNSETMIQVAIAAMLLMVGLMCITHRKVKRS
jgi:hypothetical protein